MKYNPQNGKDVHVVDFRGRPVPGVHTFDTETGEAEVYLVDSSGKFVVVQKEGSNEGEALKIKTVLRGCKVVPNSAVGAKGR